MPFAELKNNLLKARTSRQDCVDEIMRVTDQTLVQLALNIPGEQKCPPGIDRLICWADEQLCAIFPNLLQLYEGTDALGPWSIYMTPLAPEAAKLLCCEIESNRPFSRLLDIDVYSVSGQAIDRQRLNIDQRRCLVCSETAKECIRVQRHSRSEINVCLHRLLESVPT